MVSASRRLLIDFLIACIVIGLCAVVQILRAQNPDAQQPPKDLPAAAPAASQSTAQGEAFDPGLVSSGMAAFSRSCTKCHEASRALERTKDLAGWRATVQRMASRRGADIPSQDIEPIAVYLASLSASAAAAPGGEPTSSGDKTSLSGFATLSPLWRGGNANVQNPDFFPEAWAGASWQGKIVSARISACVSCHGVKEGALVSRIEVVEAAVALDFSKWLEGSGCRVKASVEAGRFVAPFGAFSAQVNPSLYYTVSKPLIFNMGQRIFNDDLGQPVLPMPYADEGVNLNLGIPLAEIGTGPITATLDGYVVNGLAGADGGLDFEQSRDLVDNNHRVAGGGRITLGGQNIRAGASITSGRFNDPAEGAFAGGLNYLIYGVDLQAHYKDLLRFQVEYARRQSDRFDELGRGPELFSEKVDGYYLEVEVRPWEKSRLSLLGRYDRLCRNSPLPPQESTLTTGSFNVQRFTWGINVVLWRQSLLMFNHERWCLPNPLHNQDVFGVRYVITF